MPENVSASASIPPECGRQPSDLYKLCYNHLPEHRKFRDDHGLLDVAAISEEMSVTRQNIFLWLKNNRLPAHRVMQMINLRGSKLTLEMLAPYMSVGRRSPSRT